MQKPTTNALTQGTKSDTDDIYSFTQDHVYVSTNGYGVYEEAIRQMVNMTPLKSRAGAAGIRLDCLGESEHVLVCCAIAREKIEIGDYDGGCTALNPWWKLGEWPRQVALEPLAAAELLLTTGSLSDSVARAKRIVGGQRLAEALISGAIAIFDCLGETTRAVEAESSSDVAIITKDSLTLPI